MNWWNPYSNGPDADKIALFRRKIQGIERGKALRREKLGWIEVTPDMSIEEALEAVDRNSGIIYEQVRRLSRGRQ